MTIIYKKDTKGNIRYLRTWTTGDILHQESGIVGTDSPVPHEKVCTPKNVGRANETNGKDQAMLEMSSLIAEKLKGGYFLTEGEAKGGSVILPMLAKSYKDEAKKIDWKNAYVQPKLDGMRCLIEKNGLDVTLTSREGTVITTMKHIEDDFFHNAPDGIYDGELYAHGETFQGNMRLIKKWREGESDKVKFHCYDVILDKPFTSRLLHRPTKLKTVVLVRTLQVVDEKNLKKQHAVNIAEGYEGSILRWGDTPYKVNGRSSNLLKYKDFLDLACEIINFEPAKDRPTWAVPVFKYNDKEFRAGMKYSHAEREDFLKNKNKYIGKIAELRFFEWTEDQIPRFPVMVGIRQDRTTGDK